MASNTPQLTQDEQVTNVVKKWLEGFEEDWSNEEVKQSALSVYDPSIVWTDHAFHIQRQGREAIIGLQKAFNHCNQPFRSDVKAIHHTSSGAVVEVIWVGRCANDIVRPDGQIAVKAHGKGFRNHVCFVMEINPASGITKIDEYYNKIWEDGVSVESYHRITGASMKA